VCRSSTSALHTREAADEWPCDTRRVRRTRLALVVVIAGMLGVTPGWAGEDARAVRERVRASVAQYERDLVTLVADERYVQTIPASGTSAEFTRILDSEFGWVAIPALGETVGVREVLRVGGRPVNAERRLRGLLERPPANPSREIAAMLAESATYNIGPVQRTINFPTFALAYLRPATDDGIRWRIERRPDGLELQFEERGRSTVIRSQQGRRSPARGSFLVDLETGRVLGTALVVSIATDGVRREYRQDVQYARHDRLGLWLPVRMHERATASGGLVEVEGEATYGNYRRYETGGRLIP
jgi:hypothetical protein